VIDPVLPASVQTARVRFTYMGKKVALEIRNPGPAGAYAAISVNGAPVAPVGKHPATGRAVFRIEPGALRGENAVILL